ncbi:hypothetical protein GUJ93_ZPchr0012g19602 [Zizania palustris]|uniref:NAD(P)H-hydrate epimerase n=1 Tax=Zizania palustris TaxID=103762 RepID=A0A8J5WKN5_ZIZPA|nr:hypothetical protein GUJ93_ZPchr0012g19602 [Zizania palustris]
MASPAASASSDSEMTHLSQRDAAEIDQQLMGPLGFSVDQLMASPPRPPSSPALSAGVISSLTPWFGALCHVRAGARGAERRGSRCGDLPGNLSEEFDIIIDAMFGFSFHGTPRPPFDDLIHRLVSLSVIGNSAKRPAIVSIDIPSGWHVEEGDVNGEGFKPDMLVSLTVPKLCARKFTGPNHFLGGRFVPPPILRKYRLHLPPYPGTSMCVRIGKAPSVDISSLRENYISPELLENQVMSDPFDQFIRWFDEAVTAGLREPNAMALTTANKEGKVSSRMVLLKGVDKQGFVW